MSGERSCFSCHHRFDEDELAELANGELICERCDEERLVALLVEINARGAAA